MGHTQWCSWFRNYSWLWSVYYILYAGYMQVKFPTHCTNFPAMRTIKILYETQRMLWTNKVWEYLVILWYVSFAMVRVLNIVNIFNKFFPFEVIYVKDILLFSLFKYILLYLIYERSKNKDTVSTEYMAYRYIRCGIC